MVSALTASIFTGQFVSPLISQPVVAHWGFVHLYLATGTALAALAALIVLGGRYAYTAVRGDAV